MGLSQLKNSASYVWASECVPLSNKPLAFTMINVFDAFPIPFLCLYFAFVSKDWYPLQFYVLLLSYFSFVLTFLCPESPRWLLVNGRTKEAIEVLNYIARWNGNLQRIADDAQFVEDPTTHGGAVAPEEARKRAVSLVEVQEVSRGRKLSLNTSKDKQATDRSHLQVT